MSRPSSMSESIVFPDHVAERGLRGPPDRALIIGDGKSRLFWVNDLPEEHGVHIDWKQCPW